MIQFLGIAMVVLAIIIWTLVIVAALLKDPPDDKS